LLLGGAGVGKTHGICDIAHDRFRRGLYTIVLFGEQFTSGDEPWERVRQLLGFGLTDRDGILEALDTAGASSGSPLLLCIDGINESRPRGYWRAWLAAFATQVARYPNIRFCVSCRTTYESVCVPDGHALERIEHVGFGGLEFTACRHFFAFYGLEVPVAPSFHPEFANPLFLRLVGETLRAAGARRMPAGWHGLNTALQAFLREKNRAFAREYDRDERERVPQLALHEFMAEVERTRRVYLRWSDAAAIISRVQPAGLVGPTVLEWLVRAGLLTTDVEPNDGNPDAEEVVRVAFERLGDHLFAARLLAGIKPGQLRDAIESGPLRFALVDARAVRDNRGLVEALSIQVPEHADFSAELADLLPKGDTRDAVLRATISVLPWRDPEHMAERTKQLVFEGLTTRGYGHEVFDTVLSVATQVTAPDAFWLHGLLVNQPMQARDGFLCGYLHQRVEVSSAVERLLRAPHEVDSADIPEQVALRWAILLLWFCVAADRRVRDRATKGLVAITKSRPKLWVPLIEMFALVDDEYVVERCFCAAYGVLLRTRDPEAERQVAAATYAAVFEDPTAIQNALIRDHARCIIELAMHDGVLPEHVEIHGVRPPYESDWPLTIPSEGDVQPFRDARRDYPKLYMSCTDDDFFTYTLSALRPYEHAVSRVEMGRWILRHVVSDLGYGGEVLASYDGNMIYTHGGGRGRPGWAERIGKKYQWIALSRLAARLADHVKPKADRWDPKPKGIPLLYSRGRDIDPGLLVIDRVPRREAEVWWLPLKYDFAAVSGQTNAIWVADPADVPSSEQVLKPIARTDGGTWQLLEGYPSWSASTNDDEDGAFTPHRQVWTQIRGYLVKRKSAERVFKWMARQHFMGRWMPEGAEFHEGYVGEYPWGNLFTTYTDEWHSRGGREKAPARLVPVCNSISSNYEEDASQMGGITVHVPARVFFEEEGRLRWDGLSGYRDEQGRLRFLDPSVAESGFTALLVDRSYLLDFLSRNEMAVVWSVLGEKIYIGGHADASPRLEFSRAHMLDESGILRSSDLTTPAN
jgi:hypothetical protein